MTTPRPQTTSNQLLEKIERLSNAGGPLDEFALRRLDREADQLIGVDAAHGYGAKAGVAALRCDVAATQRFANLAVKNAPGDLAVLANAAISLHLAGAVEESIEYLRRGLAAAPGDTTMARDLYRRLLELGQPHEAERVAQGARKAGAQIESIEIENLRGHVAILDETQVKPEQLAREVMLTRKVLRSHGLRPVGLSYAQVVDPDTGAHCMVHVLGFKGEVRQAIAMENELAEMLGEYDDWDPLRLNIQFRAVPDGNWDEHFTR